MIAEAQHAKVFTGKERIAGLVSFLSPIEIARLAVELDDQLCRPTGVDPNAAFIELMQIKG